jgi:hypothetical protein
MAGAGAVENQTAAVRGTCKSCNTDDERLTFMVGSFSLEPIQPAVAYRFSPIDVNGNPVFTRRHAEYKEQQQQTETKTEAKAVAIATTATPPPPHLFSAREIGQSAAHAYHHNCFRFILDDDYIEMEKTIPLIADTIKEVTRLCGIYSTLDSLREYFNGRVSECKANDTRRRDQNLVMDYIRVKRLKESDIPDILKSLVCMTIEKLINSKSSDSVLFFCSKMIFFSSSLIIPCE